MSDTQVNIADCISGNMSAVQMEKFKCHKEVHALPMSAKTYFVTIRKARIPEGINESDSGYLVCYSRGTNDEYVSWSPEKQFVEGYSLIPDDFLGRITNEAAELKVNLDKLSAFIDSDKFLNLDRDNCLQLQNQRDHMQGYWDTLMKRIELNQ